jgi:hypothetical protein
LQHSIVLHVAGSRAVRKFALRTREGCRAVERFSAFLDASPDGTSSHSALNRKPDILTATTKA